MPQTLDSETSSLQEEILKNPSNVEKLASGGAGFASGLSNLIGDSATAKDITDYSSKLYGFRQSQAAYEIGKKLFSGGNEVYLGGGENVTAMVQFQNASLVIQNMRNALKSFGIQVPDEVKIGIDAAQAILAGGAIVEGVQAGLSVGQMVNPALVGVGAITTVLDDLHLLPPGVNQLANIGTNLALVISSGGLNVLADIGLVVSIISAIVSGALFGSQAAADRMAKQNAYQWYKDRANYEVGYNNAQILGMISGEQNFFDGLANIISNTQIASVGDQFVTLLGNIDIKDLTGVGSSRPLVRSLTTYMPRIENYVVGQGLSEGLFENKKSNFKLEFQSYLNNKSMISDALIQAYLVDPFYSLFYDTQDSNYISLKSLCVIGMMMAQTGGSLRPIDYDFDITGFISSMGLTPYYLGDPWVFEGRFSHTNDFNRNAAAFNFKFSLPYQPISMPEVLINEVQPTFFANGNPYWAPKDLDRKNYRDYVIGIEKYMYFADRLGRIDLLMEIPEAVARMKRWGKVQFAPFYGRDGEPQNSILKFGSAPVSSLSFRSENDKVDYIRKNYSFDCNSAWQMMMMVSQLQRANYFKEKASFLSIFTNAEKLSEQAQISNNFFMMKTINVGAKKNVARYLDTTPERMVRRQTSENAPISWKVV